MRNLIDVQNNKEYITHINEQWVFFKFSDGTQDRVKSQKQDLLEVQKWIEDELEFYNRMHRVTKEIYDTEEIDLVKRGIIILTKKYMRFV